MNARNAGKLISPALLMCLLFFQTQRAGAAPLVLGYYTNWSTYGDNFKPGNIASGVDEILYAFAEVGDCAVGTPQKENNYNRPGTCLVQKNAQGVILHSGTQDFKLYPTDAWSDFCVYNNKDGVNIGGLCNLGNALATNKPVLYSIGGWTLSAAIRGAIQPANVSSFISSIIALLQKAESDAAAKGLTNKRFAGVDVDWEPNGNMWTIPQPKPQPPPPPDKDPGYVTVTIADLTNYRNFLTQLKTALSAAGYSTLTIAMTANPSVIADVNAKSPGYWTALASAGVELNLMTYDYNGQAFPGTCTTTQFNSPLHGDSSNPCADAKTFDTNDSVAALKAAGVPAASIGIGLPAY